jgi:hypothetical protein
MLIKLFERVALRKIISYYFGKVAGVLVRNKLRFRLNHVLGRFID